MNFVVLWLPAAENQLAALWTAATDQAAVTAAAHRIDQQLGRDPLNVGEERPPSRRILFDPPLGVVYEVDTAGRLVWVVSAGWSGGPV